MSSRARSRRVALAFATVVFTLALLAAGLRLWAQERVAQRIRITSHAGIDSLEKVRLGGVDQWVLIRGWNRHNPVMLFVHGGPGFPEMPFSHRNAALERDFVVVQWDQRGAGKSYSGSVPSASMNLEQFVADAQELSRKLAERFGQRKIHLVAHSWGSMVGLLAVVRSPELFEDYIGISQISDVLGSEKLLYAAALAEAKRLGNNNAASQLANLGPPPYSDQKDFSTMRGWIDHFSSQGYQEVHPRTFVRLALDSPAYGWADLVRLPLGYRFSYEHLWQAAYYTKLQNLVTRVDVPLTMFKWIIPVTAVLCLSVLFSWRWAGWQALNAEIRHKFPTVSDIQTRSLAAWLGDPQRPAPVLLDVREPAEFNVSHLAGARRVEPGSNPAALNLRKDQPIVTYCSVGYRSADYAHRLQEAGYTNVQNLKGSIFQWANEGRPVVKDGEPATKVHPYNKTWGLLLKPALRADVPPAGKTP